MKCKYCGCENETVHKSPREDNLRIAAIGSAILLILSGIGLVISMYLLGKSIVAGL